MFDRLGLGSARHPALAALAGACGAGHVHPAASGDHVAGVAVRWVVAPRDARQVARVLGIAAEHDLTVAVTGAGTKLDWGTPPVGADVLVSTARLGGADPGPYPGTVTVGAGVPLRALRAALARRGLRWPLEVASPAATVGGVISADESGPLRLAFGTATDLVAGLAFVTADGVQHHRQVDIGRADPVDAPAPAALLVGGFGTLGVVTGAVLRVARRPPAAAWVVRSVRSPAEVRDLTVRALGAHRWLTGFEVDLPVGPATVAAHVEGHPGEVATRVRALRRTLGGDATERREPPSWWGRYPFLPGGAALRLSVPFDQVHAAVYLLRDALGGVVPVRGCAGAGVVHAGLPPALPAHRVRDALAAVRATLAARGGVCTLLWAPPDVRQIAEDAGGHGAPLTLPALAKTWFDPGRRLVPGRLPALP